MLNELFRSKFKTSNDVVNGLLNGEKESSLVFGLLSFCFLFGFSVLLSLVPCVSKLLPPTFDDDSSLISTSHKFWVVFCLAKRKISLLHINFDSFLNFDEKRTS